MCHIIVYHYLTYHIWEPHCSPSSLLSNLPISISSVYNCNSLSAMYSMFSRMFSPEVTAAAERAYQLNHDAGNSNIRVMDPDPATSNNLRTKVNLSTTPQTFMQTMIQESMKPKFPPPENLPCANVEVAKHQACKNPGKLACSACKLVSYCSKVRWIG